MVRARPAVDSSMRSRRIARRVAEIMSDRDGRPVASDYAINQYVKVHRVELIELAARWDLAGDTDLEALDVLATAAADGRWEWTPDNAAGPARPSRPPAAIAPPDPDRFVIPKDVRDKGRQEVAAIREQLAAMAARRGMTHR